MSDRHANSTIPMINSGLMSPKFPSRGVESALGSRETATSTSMTAPASAEEAAEVARAGAVAVAPAAEDEEDEDEDGDDEEDDDDEEEDEDEGTESTDQDTRATTTTTRYPITVPYSESFHHEIMACTVDTDPWNSIYLSTAAAAAATTADPTSRDVNSAQSYHHHNNNSNNNFDGDNTTDTTDQFPLSSLPLPLLHPSRIFPSPHASIKLTQPSGSLYGGPSPHARADLMVQAQRLVGEHGLTSRDELLQLIDARIGDELGELQARMESRREAGEENDAVRRKVLALVQEREIEVRIAERWRAAKKSGMEDG